MKNKKNFLIPATIAVAAFLTVYSCMQNAGNGTNTNTTMPTETTLSKHLLPIAKAKILSNEYEKENYQKVNVGKSQAETKEVFYDLEALEEYLKYVKAEATKAGIDDVGIIVAFGQYPENEIFDERLKSEYKGQQTVYLKASVNPKMAGNKIGKGGSIDEQGNNSLENINAFDFGQLTPPEN